MVGGACCEPQSCVGEMLWASYNIMEYELLFEGGRWGSNLSIHRWIEVLWENLEYARLQVRLLKNSNAKVTKSMRIKSMRINGQMLSIYIEEEHPTKFEVSVCAIEIVLFLR